jgi:phosphate transport system substrate-binding protein
MVLVTAGTFTIGFAGAGIALTAGPALADPTCQEAAVGSDTIQDVMNQYSVDLTGNLLCSYNAVDPVSGAAGNNISYIRGLNATEPATTCTYTRPNGSNQGIVALRESIDPATTATPPLATVAPQNCVDIALSSSGPTSNTAGALAYIPFAEDAVTGAVGPATAGTVQGINGPETTVATSITQGGLFTKADLVDLYTDCTTVAVGGVTYWPLGDPTAEPVGAQQIDLYVPQSGSGTRNFWASTLGFNATTLPSCVFSTVQNGADKNDAVEQNDGTAVATDQDGYEPFSIAQWVSQSKHTAGGAIDLDRRYGAALQDIGGVAPYSGTVPNETMNASFPINREVYNIVEGCRVDSTAPLPFTGATCSLDPNLEAMLSGTGSSLCQDELTILNYGFALLVNNSNEPNTCGQIAPALRSQAPPV